jgi:stage III sporulation protein AG
MGFKIADISDKTKSVTQMLKKNKFILIALIAGILILLLPWGGSKNNVQTVKNLPIPEFSLEDQEKKIEAVLSKISGAGKVTVALSLKNDIEREIAWDQDISFRSDENGASESDSKSTAVSLQTGSGYQSPITIKYVYPCYQGALVITESDSPEVKYQLTRAVSSLTGLTTDKITVVRGK